MSIFEESGGTYENANGYQIPVIHAADSTPIGKWGRMRKRYLLRAASPALHRAPALRAALSPSGGDRPSLRGAARTADPADG